MEKQWDGGAGILRGRDRALRLVQIFTLLVALTALRPAAQAQERLPLAPELLPASAVLRAAPHLAHGNTVPRPGAGFLALHGPSHIDDEDAAAGEETEEESAGAEEDDGSSGWFGAEIVFLVIGVDEKDDDGQMRGFNLSLGFGKPNKFGLGLMAESGRLVADISVAGRDEMVHVDGDYSLVGPTIRFGGPGISGSGDFLFGDSNDQNVSSLASFRLNFRVGVGPISSGVYIGLSVGLLFIELDEDVGAFFGELNVQWGLLLGGQF